MNLTTERVTLSCGVAADLIHKGQYEAAREALGELWQGVGQRPDVKGLPPLTAAEALLQCGTLTGWLGSARNVGGAQERAKDLLSESLRGFVFASPRTGVNFTSLRDGFMRACELAEIPYGLHTPNGITLHSLRHTFATRLQDRNIHPYTIMALMGHSSPKMSAVYSHASPDAVEAAVSRLEGRGEVLEFALRQNSAIGVSDGFTAADAIPASG